MSGRGRGRGRRPNASKLIQQNLENGEVSTETNDIIQNNEKPKKTTTKKKQFPVVAVITPDGIQGSLHIENRRPLIVHLPIQSRDVIFNDVPITYDPHPPVNPEAYNSISCNPFHDTAEEVNLITDMDSNVVNNKTVGASSNNVPHSNESKTEVQTNNSINDFYNLKETLLVQYKNSSEIKKLPLNSDAACFWCCHTFDWRPVILPLRDQGDYLQVFGNYCCPECAMAHLFDIRQDSHTRWEQLAILNRLYKEYCGGKIYPAPSRNILKHFGGTLSIDEYRNLIRSQKVRVDIHIPPMVSLLSTMDTKPIDFYDTALTKNVNETVKERLQKAEEVLKLRRTKPLKAWESTLDACMNLKIRHDESKY
jgi:hypothetical protein